ncbi:hypothetical protein PINS_up023786 [Pythium insidiosum]|nr:hypothetical protein PINS_up023786 [Pythium insidiosum]
MEVHVQGFPERHYVARMAAMNKPTYMAIRTHSPEQPVLVFVSSKAQTKLTALDLISCCVAQGENAKPFLRVDEAVIDAIVASHGGVADTTLQHTLAFGIGLHHAALGRRDRELVERLFRERLIQVVISTATLAWGVNLPAHLVVIKGTEFFSGGRYRSYPLSDLLQMIGRAGRPGLDDKGVACVLVEDAKKNMISRLLYEPLALESCLGDTLENHVNAEIASGWVRSRGDVLQFLSWSLLFQRVVKNPSFYQQQQLQESKGGASYLERLVDQTVDALVKAQCVTRNKDELQPSFLGRIAAALYVDVRSVSRMHRCLQTLSKQEKSEGVAREDQWLVAMLRVLCECSVELADATPLRHHEVQSGLMAQWCDAVRHSPLTQLFTASRKKQAALLETHGSEAKAFVLLQMHVLRQRLPTSDLAHDLRALLEQVPRLLSARDRRGRAPAAPRARARGHSALAGARAARVADDGDSRIDQVGEHDGGAARDSDGDDDGEGASARAADDRARAADRGERGAERVARRAKAQAVCVLRAAVARDGREQGAAAQARGLEARDARRVSRLEHASGYHVDVAVRRGRGLSRAALSRLEREREREIE